MTTIRFHTLYSHEDQATLHKAQYGDGSTALLVTDAVSGEPISKCTVCLMDYHEKPADNHVFIKDYAENQGVLKALLDAGVIGAAVRTVPCGYEVVYECPLTGKVD